MAAVAPSPRRLPLLVGAGLAIVLLAALLRLWAIDAVPGNTFYDAAVRSMARSWHNFFFGALEPGGSVSIDKPPVDLWFQVASTKLFGPGRFALHLPEALAGTAAAGALMVMLARTVGIAEGLVAGLALAVVPISVLTSRSDTMDSLLALLLVCAFWLSLHALRTGQRRWILLAAATMGVAFNVKLSESLIPLPAIALLWWWTLPRGAGRLLTVAGAGATYVVVSLSWAFTASLTALSSRPFPIGSTTGSIWRLLFVYNGTDRLTGKGNVSAIASGPGGGPGPLRLLDTGSSHYGSELGGVLLAALVFGTIALVLAALAGRARLRSPSSLAGRCTAALALWLLTGVLLFSAMRRLEPRYLEVIAPAACGILAISLVRLISDWPRAGAVAIALAALGLFGYQLLARSGGNGATVLVVAAGCVAATAALVLRGGGDARRLVLGGALAVELFAGPLGASVTLIGKHTSDSLSSDPIQPRLSAYLLAHRGGARYEVVAGSVFNAAGIVASDGLPVLILNDVSARIVRLAQLKRAVASGQVRYFYAPGACRPHRRCLDTMRFSLDNSIALPHSQLRQYTAPTSAAPAHRP